MAIKRQLAVYFSADALSLVELERAKIINYYHVPYDLFTKEDSKLSPNLTEEIKLTAVLQKALRDNKIETVDCFTSIATKDIILRSFLIPQMNTSEIVGAVEFEVRKYMPFKIDELIYDFQTTKVKDSRAKKLRVLFVGIRKDILLKYLYILEQSNLKVASLEPSPISLLRILTQKKLIASNHSCAVIEIDNEQGNIMILDRGLPQFIRDFKLMPSAVNIGEDKEEDSSFIRLLNEVRVSLDYYRREFSHGVFDKIIFCSERDIRVWAENLQKELNLPVVYLKPQDILALKDFVDIGLLKAVGAGVRDYVNLPITINLSHKRFIQEGKEGKTVKQAQVQPLKLNLIIRWGLGIAVFVILFSLFNMRQIWDLESRLKKINVRYAGKTPDEITQMITDAKEKVKSIEQIKARKYFAPQYVSFARLLPNGVWINNLEMQYNEMDRSLGLTLGGYVYSEQEGSDINIVNQFLNNLKKDADFAKPFKSIDLNFVNQGTIGGLRVTNFEIKCR